MAEHRNKRTAWIIISISMLSMFGLLYAVCTVSVTQHTNRIWKNHYTVLVRRDRIKTENFDRIDKNFTAVHYYNTEVEFFDYPGLERIPLREVNARFDPLDPRADRYIRNLGQYFSSPDNKYAIIYINTATNPLSLVLSLRKLLGPSGGDWYVADVRIIKHLFLTGAFVVLVFLCTFISSKNRFFAFLYGLPWLPLFLFGNFSVFAVASLLFFSFCRSITDLDSLVKERLNHGNTGLSGSFFKHILFRFIISFAAVSIFSFVTKFSKVTTLAVMLAFTADLAITGILVGRTLIRYSAQAHRLFFHIPLGTKRGLKVQKGRVLFPIVLLPIVLAFPFVLRQFDEEVQAGVPAPLEEGIVREVDYRNIRKVGVSEAEEIPALPDFVAHRYFQEGYLYRREFKVPGPDERVYLSAYEQKKDGKIEVTRREALYPGEQWLKSTLEGGGEEGIIAMLLDQNTVFKVSYQNIKNMPFKNREIIIYYLTWLWVQIPGLFYLAYLTPVRLYDMKSVELKKKCKAV